MAAAGFSDFNETEYFEEYNPHPYQGGYDIALTYGNPLPPFSAICYPISDSSFDPPLPPKAPLPSVPLQPPASSAPDYGSSSSSSSYGYAADWWWNLSARYDAEETRYWRPLRRAADYIFGYSEGFGERRIGVDTYGIPIYAYKMTGSDAVSVEIQPARTEELECHGDSEKWSSSTYDESVFSWKPSHGGLYDEQVHPERQWVPLSYGESRNEVNLYGNMEMAYDRHCYGGARNVQLEAVESSFQKLSYHEALEEFSYTDSRIWEPSYSSIHGDDRNSFADAYHRHDYQQQSDVELEPYKPTWAQYTGYYGISEEDVYAGSQPVQISDYSEVYNESSSLRSAWQTSSFGEWGNEGKYHSSEYAYQTHHDDHSLELEPFKSTWTLNPNYYGSYKDVSAPYNEDDGSYGSVW